MALANTNLDSPPKANVLHAHRLENSKSKLPAFRFADLRNRVSIGVIPTFLAKESASPSPTRGTVHLPNKKSNTIKIPEESLLPTEKNFKPSTPPETSPATSPTDKTEDSVSALSPKSQPKIATSRPRPRRQPASHSSNGIDTQTGPPPALSTHRSFAAKPAQSPSLATTEWALAQQDLAFNSSEAVRATKTTTAKPADEPAKPTRAISRSLDETKLTGPVIPPIRSFRASATRKSLDMYSSASHRYGVQSNGEDEDDDPDRTLRALEGFSDGEQFQASQSRRRNVVDPTSGDLFLSLAHDDMSRQPDANGIGDTADRADRRRSRIALSSNRQSLPLDSMQSPSPQMPRHGSDPPSLSRNRGLPTQLQSTYRPLSRDPNPGSPARQVDLSKTLFPARPSPTTPRSPGGFDSPIPYDRRRPSVPDTAPAESNPARAHIYRRSTLSHSTPRMYNSSPLVSRSMDFDEEPDMRRAAEGTESTASTTAPSTVWDELDDLKSRIRKLELTGKLPATSGAAVSHATGDRPPTATTTITTLSSSPKRGRRLSVSPNESTTPGQASNEANPLLHSALAKTKPILPTEVYKALESTASDALSMASMVGSVGQPGPISSAQSAIGVNNGTGGITDRQLRRKAESICRNLTELCLALSEAQKEPTVQTASKPLSRPGSRDMEQQGEPQQRVGNDNYPMATASQRAMSRLEARRSSLLSSSALPSPRFTAPTPAESTTPTQNTVGGRRNSLLRSRRAGTEELEEEAEALYRAPSRATTEVGRGFGLRNPSREIGRDYPMPSREDLRAPSTPSNLPVRRNYGLPTSTTLPNLSGRRYLDRNMSERETSSVVGRLADERSQRPQPQPSLQGYGLGRTISVSSSMSMRRPNTDAVHAGYH